MAAVVRSESSPALMLEKLWLSGFACDSAKSGYRSALDR